MDVLLKSFSQIFNPTVEAGPGRLTSHHPYEDRIMPDYPAGPGPCGRGCRRRKGTRATADDECDAPTADYVDGGPDEWTATGGGDDARTTGPADDGGRANADAVGYVTGERPLTDFIVSVLQTLQLTARAKLKRSAKSGRAAAAGGSTANTEPPLTTEPSKPLSTRRALTGRT